ncbi:uncharacterized protein J8A68_004642 [[Candida] subhashii]|uniref:Uncharacterized protein n=1 Tax=[Candida] subhashii TaxID=561895 RepID=A0A8J5QGW9_9ASCO|nr:uncharacterized protein J8A68_004642 [[Candida] subhashii]KAG7661843.1 hypothetical protein J8A68_004642 [[Candida] subhashii]
MLGRNRRRNMLAGAGAITLGAVAANAIINRKSKTQQPVQQAQPVQQQPPPQHHGHHTYYNHGYPPHGQYDQPGYNPYGGHPPPHGHYHQPPPPGHYHQPPPPQGHYQTQHGYPPPHHHSHPHAYHGYYDDDYSPDSKRSPPPVPPRSRKPDFSRDNKQSVSPSVESQHLQAPPRYSL